MPAARRACRPHAAPRERRLDLVRLVVSGRVSVEAAALAAKVDRSTVWRWKLAFLAEDSADGDDVRALAQRRRVNAPHRLTA